MNHEGRLHPAVLSEPVLKRKSLNESEPTGSKNSATLSEPTQDKIQRCGVNQKSQSKTIFQSEPHGARKPNDTCEPKLYKFHSI